MDARIKAALEKLNDFRSLADYASRLKEQNAISPEVEVELRRRRVAVGRALISRRTGLDLSVLTPAEERIVEAVSTYLSLKQLKGTNANRTLLQIRNRGLLGTAEASVTKGKPTQGFRELTEEKLDDLSFEQIVIDHPEEFSDRAHWYSKRTLGLATEGDRPPPDLESQTQSLTRQLIEWLRGRAAKAQGHLADIDSSDLFALLDLEARRHGRVLGNLVSRVDFACYRMGLPPLGLTMRVPFKNAWSSQTRNWHFPIDAMQAASTSRRWTDKDFDELTSTLEKFQLLAASLWLGEYESHAQRIRSWAHSFPNASSATPQANGRHPQISSSFDDEADIATLAARDIELAEALPEQRQHISKKIERSQFSERLKKLSGYQCQLCKAAGLPPLGFRTRNGTHYVEAHHVIPVSTLMRGALAAHNIMILCANHHRQMHFGSVRETVLDDRFLIEIEDHSISVPKLWTAAKSRSLTSA